jgi:type IV pilus assembly protein PilC
MPANGHFRYVGRSASGKRVSGVVAASTRGAAIRAVDGRHVSLIVLERADGVAGSYEGVLGAAAYWWHGLRLPVALLTLFRQLALFERHGITIQRGLGLCMASCPNPRLREALRGVLEDVADRGASLHNAMASRPGEFAPVIVAMVGAAEEGAGFAQVLARIAVLLERGKRVFGKVQRALYYPAAVLLGVVALVVWLATAFIPQFSALAAQYHQGPSSDLARVSAVAAVLTSPVTLTVLLGAVALAVTGIRRLLQQRDVATWYDERLLALPLFGAIRMKSTVATLSRVLGALLAAGVPYERALGLVIGTVASPVYRRGIEQIRDDIRANGGTFSSAASRTGLFEADFLALVAAGEESTSAADMLAKIADDYDDDVERDLDAATALLEPALIAVLGFAVMLVVGVVYGSLYHMMSGIR